MTDFVQRSRNNAYLRHERREGMNHWFNKREMKEGRFQHEVRPDAIFHQDDLELLMKLRIEKRETA